MGNTQKKYLSSLLEPAVKKNHFPVSYTHLDVYKRQRQGDQIVLSKSNATDAELRQNEDDNVFIKKAQDVYKRQDQDIKAVCAEHLYL